jgi:hypothetical protein
LSLPTGWVLERACLRFVPTGKPLHDSTIVKAIDSWQRGRSICHYGVLADLDTPASVVVADQAQFENLEACGAYLYPENHHISVNPCFAA